MLEHLYKSLHPLLHGGQLATGDENPAGQPSGVSCFQAPCRSQPADTPKNPVPRRSGRICWQMTGKGLEDNGSRTMSASVGDGRRR